MISYFRNLSTAQYLLWGYLIWYLTISVIYFDSDAKIWISALGISAIVGFAFVLSTTCWPINIKALDRWQTLRLFLIPFCVSSYSSLIKGKGFMLIFPPDIKTNGTAILAIVIFVGLIQLSKQLPVKSC
ncbi:MAG TPA: hypothetical protein ENJ87_06090 [Gammaproteobacteria bacterium]|nr:hypothetical protein [Gammaproteobacteria bacterium]